MSTTTLPSARGVALLATHPQLLAGAHAVSVYPDRVAIQGNVADNTGAISALARLDPRAAFVPGLNRIDEATDTYYRHFVGHVETLTVDITVVMRASYNKAVA